MVTKFKTFESVNSYYNKIKDKALEIIYIYNDASPDQAKECALARLDYYIEEKNLSKKDLEFYKNVKIAIEKNCDYSGWYDTYTDFKSNYDNDTNKQKIKKYINKILKEYSHIDSYTEKSKNVIKRINQDKNKNKNDIELYDDSIILFLNFHSKDGWEKF